MKIFDGIIEVEASAHGAELLSIRRDSKEYVWQGDPKFWGRHAPVLFPLVGKVWNNEYRVDGKVFTLGQHGFARDMDFEELPQTEPTKMAFRLCSNEQTRELYPYDFELTVEFEVLDGVLAKRSYVRNTGGRTMYYMLGDHPAFYYKDFNPDDEIHGYASFFNGEQVLKTMMLSPLTEHGALKDEKVIFNIPDGILELKASTFDDDALVFENSQTDMVILYDKDRRAYLGVGFTDAQTLGIWSSKGKNAPFVCVEPWNGLTDPEGFDGDISERAWIQRLDPGEQRRHEYMVTPIAED